ncbi:MAG: hypothetical protein Q9219_003939 [cf. Caloplaca sp. 3 TL-2023]
MYSAPSGMFKPHVDTPRGATQFGSLVVCLPFRHRGGDLHISHHDRPELVLSWGGKDASIEWVAFYSDCKHGIKEVTEGHRVTLTYNLYAHEQVGDILPNPSPVGTNSFVLYHRAKEALSSPDFLPEGGQFFVSAASHWLTIDGQAGPLDFIVRMPLEGIDAVIFSVFDRLGFSVSLHAVIEDLEEEDYGYSRDEDSDRANADLVAHHLPGLKLSSDGSCEEPTIERNDIAWFGSPGNQEMAVVHLAYGNEASVEWHYSTTAILVKDP